MNKFLQIRVSKSVVKFKKQMMEKYDLKPYKYDDIIKIINEEYQNRFEDNLEIVDKTYNFINLSNEWLYY